MVTDVMDALNNSAGGSSDILNTFFLFTVIALVPTLLVLTTSFTRIIVVLSFTRNALGTQQSPPNLVLTGLALFLSFFIMRPIFDEIAETALTPYINEEITVTEALTEAQAPLKGFMLENTRGSDLELFIELAEEQPDSPEEVAFLTVVPAFAISELRTAFTIGFLIFIPFLVIDIVVASILMSMGMFMLSPVMISLPFKLLLFVLVDGWYLVVESLVNGFL
ncbi:flagellar type III secretion system pore protein FliP [Lacticigenium naphthae]|uniref:flagellar type III secretion system pore protein FliP n=1 Tax=Lacticigenium naphthae TaxID=515351 RepID=UPI0003FD0EBA|nr:flagellar type III secretion system pore protein FliP [Lacticigenium naphthae]